MKKYQGDMSDEEWEAHTDTLAEIYKDQREDDARETMTKAAKVVADAKLSLILNNTPVNDGTVIGYLAQLIVGLQEDYENLKLSTQDWRNK